MVDEGVRGWRRKDGVLEMLMERRFFQICYPAVLEMLEPLTPSTALH